MCIVYECICVLKVQKCEGIIYSFLLGWEGYGRGT